MNAMYDRAIAGTTLSCVISCLALIASSGGSPPISPLASSDPAAAALAGSGSDVSSTPDGGTACISTLPSPSPSSTSPLTLLYTPFDPPPGVCTACVR